MKKEEEMTESEQKKCGCYFKPKANLQRKKIIETLKNKQNEVLKKFQLKKAIKNEKRFRYGDEVKLVGCNNPFEGEVGEFRRYDKKYTDKERLTIFLYSDGKEHYFFQKEAIIKTSYFQRIFPNTNVEANRFKSNNNEVKKY